jgi:cytochrome c556
MPADFIQQTVSVIAQREEEVMIRIVANLLMIIPLISLFLAVEPSSVDAQERTEIQKKRQEIMRSNGRSIRAIGQAAKSGDKAAALAAAKTLSGNAQQYDSLFPDGSGGRPTRAKSEIWQNKSDFSAKKDNFQQAVARLIPAAESGNLEAVQSAVRRVGQTCGACHSAYRVSRGGKGKKGKRR